MKKSGSHRAAIVKRLRNLKISTKQELEDILGLTATICQTPTVLITLLDDEAQHLEFNAGLENLLLPLSETFCNHTIHQNDILEVQDCLQDERFKNIKVVTGNYHIRFYAGSPLTTHSGENIGSLCVLDTKPNLLNESQRKMLKVLSRQVATILEFELSQRLLQEEIEKLQASEMKLKSIFQSSPTWHVLLNHEMKVLACNKAAIDIVRRFNHKTLKEGKILKSVLTVQGAEVVKTHFTKALSGKRVFIEQDIQYENKSIIWWELDFNPVYNHAHEIIGVSMDAIDITKRVKFRQDVLAQNKALKEIAYIQSHEIRRPVANILGLTYLLQDQSDEYFQLHLQYLQEETKSLDQQIRRIVTVSNNANLDNQI